MFMIKQWKQFENDDIPADDQLFVMAVSLCGTEFLIVMLMSILLRGSVPVTMLLLFGLIFSVGILRIYNTRHERKALPIVYSLVVFAVLVPVLGYLNHSAVYDFPIYFIEGITFTAIILGGRQALVVIGVELAVDLYSIYIMTEQIAYELTTQGEEMIYFPVMYCRIIAAISLTGITCGMLIAYRNRILRDEIRKCTEMEEQVEKVNYAKDMFLVNVSHEIRTPLNAILGTSELLLDLDADDKVKENAFDIANSSKALLSITNDLMDFSKIDYSNIRVEEDYYYIGELFNELINMLSVRLADYNAELFVDISPNIPEKLWGDGAKFRQILSTLLISIVKSMESGEVYFVVNSHELTQKQLGVQVSISAKGTFKYSYMEQLQQEDERNLTYGDHNGALIKQFIKLLGGNLNIEEKINDRAYNFEIIQGFDNKKAVVETNREDVNILFYENSILQGSEFAKVLRSMGLHFCQASNNEFFYEECVKQCYTHIMIATERYDGIKEKLTELLPPQSLILVASGIVTYDDALIRTTFARPVNCLSIDALLAGRKNSSIRHVDYQGGFICPDARIMVVDDNMINLEVASGILKKYEAQVVLVTSGKECLNYLQDETVDYIFLDYMMPEMDGIDTLKNIRALPNPEFKQIPIVALTANAVSGAREMFLEAGFDEYISKPIELNTFERVLRELLNKDKIIYTADKEAVNEE